MKRKTAMMELIDLAQRRLIAINDFDNPHIIEQLLEKEKEQIMDAADVCLEKSGTEPEDYYNEIYKQD